MRLRIALAVLLASLVSLPMVALASDISGAQYTATVRITNNSTAATQVSTTFTLSTADLISQGYLDSAMEHIAMRSSSGADVAFMPSINATYPWAVFVDSIGANTQVNDILYLGGTTDMGVTESYFPDTSGMAVTDDADLEIADNFTLQVNDVFLTTGTIVTKPTTFLLSKDSSNNVTFDLYSSVWNSPTSHTANGWTDPANAYDDNTGTYAEYDVTGWGPYLELTHAAILSHQVRIWPSRAGAFGGDVTTMEVDVYYGGAWVNIYSNTPTYGAYNTISIGSTQTISNARVRFRDIPAQAGTSFARVNEFDYGEVDRVSISSVPDGEYDITVTADGTNMWMVISES